jgi:hypothetical protein
VAYRRWMTVAAILYGRFQVLTAISFPFMLALCYEGLSPRSEGELRMSTILIILLVVLLLGGGGGYYGYSRYGGSGIGGALGLVLIIVLGLWFFGGLHIHR